MENSDIIGVEVSAVRSGWGQIAKYLGTSESTARRWYLQDGLPVKNPAGRKVTADPKELDAWLLGQGKGK